jgi:hypothetical protein
MKGIEEIHHEGLHAALIIRSSFTYDGIKFFTPEYYSQQLGYMKRSSGYIIEPHIHKSVSREVHFTKEVLIIKSGKVKVDFYSNDKVYFKSILLHPGDIILLAYGGHGFEIIEDAEIIEVKQGPYAGDEDKIRFPGISHKS